MIGYLYQQAAPELVDARLAIPRAHLAPLARNPLLDAQVSGSADRFGYGGGGVGGGSGERSSYQDRGTSGDGGLSPVAIAAGVVALGLAGVVAYKVATRRKRR